MFQYIFFNEEKSLFLSQEAHRLYLRTFLGFGNTVVRMTDKILVFIKQVKLGEETINGKHIYNKYDFRWWKVLWRK